MIAKKSAVGMMLLGLVVGFSVVASSHPTGRESRVAAQCERLPTPERQQCLSCVTRPLKHHYHPDYPPGARCRPDNGKP
jgi:hypothetical protein